MLLSTFNPVGWSRLPKLIPMVSLPLPQNKPIQSHYKNPTRRRGRMKPIDVLVSLYRKVGLFSLYASNLMHTLGTPHATVVNAGIIDRALGSGG